MDLVDHDSEIQGVAAARIRAAGIVTGHTILDRKHDRRRERLIFRGIRLQEVLSTILRVAGVALGLLGTKS